MVVLSYILIVAAHALGLIGYIGLVLAHQASPDPGLSSPPPSKVIAPPAEHPARACEAKLYLVRAILIEAPDRRMILAVPCCEAGPEWRDDPPRRQFIKPA